MVYHLAYLWEYYGRKVCQELFENVLLNWDTPLAYLLGYLYIAFGSILPNRGLPAKNLGLPLGYLWHTIEKV